ncbi:MAG: hypothetical protein RJA61_112 [Candidatus Parcubacteria bacterium]
MFSDPQKNIEQFNPSLGARIADLGSGSGFYTLAAARAVGAEGKVYAVDVQKDLLSKLKNEANKQGMSNIEIVWGDLEKLGGTRLAPQTLNGVIVSNIFFQVKNKDIFIQEVDRILMSKGKVLFVDWAESFGGLGPQSGDVFPEKKAEEMWTKAGFIKEASISAGAHHYGIIFTKSL